MNNNNKIIAAVAAVVILVVASAAVASYVTNEKIQAKSEEEIAPVHAKAHRHTTNEQRVASNASVNQSAPAKPACNDRNIVGTVAGAAGGGLLGSQIGNGSGKTAAIIGGVLGGGYLGNQYIPTRNVTCQ